MANKAFTDLTALAETPATGDLLALTDISDTTDSANGTSKKITYDDLTSNKTSKLLTENAQVGTTYTLVLTDADKLVTLNNASAITLTIPTNASVAFSTGTQILLAQLGAGQVTIGGAGVTIRSYDSNLLLTGQYATASLIKLDTDEWILSGNLTT